MNITKSLVEMTTKVLKSKISSDEELSPSLTSELHRLYEASGELLSEAPQIRGWDLAGKDPRKVLKDSDNAVKVGDRIWSSKGVYFIWKGLLLTAVWGDTEMEEALAGLKTLDNDKAKSAWFQMNNGEEV